MSAVLQATFMNHRSFGPPAIGSAYEGGFFAGQISTTANSVATHNLVVAPYSSGNTTKQLKNANTATSGADSDINGPQNTADMVADGNSTVYPAAHFCNDLVAGGYSDWYMPAKNELEVCYRNLKPTTETNLGIGTGGINPNGVPATTVIYTSGDPAQTSATAFKTGGAEAFIASGYWCSTELNATNGVRQSFSQGYQTNGAKTYVMYLRAVRRVAV
jgi:hypothetical protein